MPMSATPDEKERSVPKPRFTDAEAGALEFPSSRSRQFNYFEPARRRATVYEDVTVDVQPDPARHLSQGWVYGFADGPGGYPTEWTQAKSSDWHRFRDPNEEWERTIYQNIGNTVRQVQANIQNAKESDSFAGWNARWVKVVSQHVGAWAHPEHGLGMHLFVPAQRDAPTNMINNAISVNSMHKLRFAQDVALYGLDLSEEIEGFEGSAHVETWQSDPVWQGVRENAERLTAIHDWAEAVFAANFVFEPLIGELFRSEFVMRVAAINGDFVTPALFGSAEGDFERDLRYSKELFTLLVEDEGHGDANKKLFGDWLAKWVPVSIDAARQLQPVWSQPAQKPVQFEDSLDRVKERARGILSELDLQIPEELNR
jgi:propane 2-monooxygenase small subunit